MTRCWVVLVAGLCSVQARAQATRDDFHVTNGTVHATALSGNRLYIGRSFDSIGGQGRRCIAALDAATGLATGWDPSMNGPVQSLTLGGSTVYAGGGFTVVGNLPRSHLAAIDATTVGVPHPHGPDAPGVQVWCEPNPFSSSTLVRYSLAFPGAVTLRIYDLAGRQMATLLNQVHQGAGRHAMHFDAERLPVGLFLCQLRVDGSSRTVKFVRVR